MKKTGSKKPPKVVQLSVHQGGKNDEPWNKSVEGVLRKALEEHEEHGFSDLVIVGLRAGGPVTLTFSRDRLRLLGLLKWASDLMTDRFKS